MFKLQRSIIAQELESRFQVDGTPDKYTLLALKLDPSVNTTVEVGIFSSRTASQQPMEGEYRRRLVRRYKLVFMADNTVVSSVSDSQVNSSAPLPAKRGAPSMGGVAKKGPASVLSRLNPDSPHDKAVLINPERVLLIGTRYNNLYTAVDTPAEAAWLCLYLCVNMCSDVLGPLSLRTSGSPTLTNHSQ
jgi:hypothetical protein